MNSQRILLLTLVLAVSAVAQTQSTEVPKKFKCYTQYSHLPKGFRDLMEICIILPDDKDASPIIGQLGTTRYIAETNRFWVFEFKHCRFSFKDSKHAKLSFSTVTKQGVRYSFIGQLLKDPETHAIGYYTHLEGVLTKFKNGRKAAQSRFDLSLGIQE